MRVNTASRRASRQRPAGEILAFEIDDLTGIGPFSMFPRTSGIEGNQVVNLTGGPYKHKAYRAKLKVVFQNKVPTCQYRGVSATRSPAR